MHSAVDAAVHTASAHRVGMVVRGELAVRSSHSDRACVKGAPILRVARVDGEEAKQLRRALGQQPSERHRLKMTTPTPSMSTCVAKKMKCARRARRRPCGRDQRTESFATAPRVQRACDFSRGAIALGKRDCRGWRCKQRDFCCRGLYSVAGLAIASMHPGDS